MSERNLRGFLLPDDQVVTSTPVIHSIKDADFRHQAFAAAHGYRSLSEMAIDELAAQLRDLQGRMDAVEALLEELKEA